MSKKVVYDDEPELTEDSPELSAADFARGRPMSEAFPQLAVHFKKMGRPPIAAPKLHIGFRFAPDVVNSIRATGRGYNARIEQILREAIEQGRI